MTDAVWRRRRRNRAEPDVALFRGDAVVDGFDRQIPARARIDLVWEPTPRVVFSLAGERDLVLQTLRGDEREPRPVQMRLGRLGSCRGFPNEWSLSAPVEIAGELSFSVTFGGSDSLASISATVINGPYVRQPIRLSGGGWLIELVPRESRGYNRNYLPTHDLRIEREDRAAFSDQAVADCVDAVRHFLTVCRGAWCSVVLLEGRSATKRILWRDWSIPRVDPARDVYSWIPRRDSRGKAVSDAWVGFSDRWFVRDGATTIRTLLPILVEAAILDDSEAGLVLSQVFLELISWIWVVEEGALLSEDGHDRLTAADRIRLLLRPSGVDTSMPGYLATAAAARGWRDGPHAITELRNAVAHPRKRRSVADLDVLAPEARVMALNYGIGAFLRYLGYKGPTELPPQT